MSDKRYFWLKLKKDFFKRHDIQIIESMPNGKDYILFYLKLLVESVDHDGNLRFNDTIPYNESMLSTITNTNIDITRAAMKVFTELKMIDVLEDKTVFMNEVQKMMGTETYWADQKRKKRAEIPVLIGNCPIEVQSLSNVSNQEIDIELDKEKEIDIKTKKPKKEVEVKVNFAEFVNMTQTEFNKLLELYGTDKVKAMITTLDNYKGSNNKKYASDYRAILSWVADKITTTSKTPSRQKDFGAAY